MKVTYHKPTGTARELPTMGKLWDKGERHLILNPYARSNEPR